MLWTYGTADPVGSVEVWQRAVGQLPNGELWLIEGAGHLPWLDEPQSTASHLSLPLVG